MKKMSRCRKRTYGDAYYSERKARSTYEAYIDLFVAIRTQAVVDNKLDEWEESWLGDPIISNIINSMLQRSIVSQSTYGDVEIGNPSRARAHEMTL
jgi:hypothetical protein